MLPRKLKHLNLFNEGFSYIGQVSSVTLPKLVRVMEEWRGGGMNAPIKVDHGMEALSMEWTCGGLMDGVLKQFGEPEHDGVLLRFAGSYNREDSADVDAVQVTLRGRHSTVDMGDAKTGEDTEFKVTTEISYIKIELNDEELVEIDVINMIERIGGVDRLADHRAAIGL